jgi:hypothetical protein
MRPRFDRGSKKGLQRDGDAGLFLCGATLEDAACGDTTLSEVSDLSEGPVGTFGENVS